MMDMDLEKAIDEIARRVQKNRNVSYWHANPQLASIANLISKLSEFPKNKIPTADFARVRNLILDRISVSAESQKERTGLFAGFPAFLKLATGIAGTLLILISLGIGTAVAALQSVPGQTIYPLKKVVESIELRLTRDPASKTNLQIKFANNRLEELTTVLERKESGELSSVEAQKIVAQTVNDLQQTTAAALSSSKANASSPTKQVSTLNKIVDLSNKQQAVLKPLLSAANISSDGEVKIVLEQALQTSVISKEEAIKNIENAGLKVEDQPIAIPETPSNQVSANGNITSITSDSISIGTAKFLMTKDTKYDNIEASQLKIGLTVKITGEVKDEKTYALTISPVENPQSETNTETNQKSGDTVTP